MNRGKGSAFEREICKRLSMWFSEGVSPDWFWRTPNSGGKATVISRKRSYKGGYGDITHTCHEGEPLTGKVCFELKRGYPKATPLEILDDPGGGVWKKFIMQADMQKKKSGCKFWALITKRDRKKIMITARRDFFLFSGLGEYMDDFNYLEITTNGKYWITMQFEDFLTAARPKRFAD